MNYEQIYQNLISHRQQNIPTGYIERHHILPRSLGGNDDPSNIVKLTGREHWVAHLLLHKIHQKSSTAYACQMMALKCEKREIPFIRNSRMYEVMKKECAKYVSKLGKQRIGEKNGSYGTMWICNIELKENKKISKDEPIPQGWIKGRNKWKRIEKDKEKNNKKIKNKNEKIEEEKKKRENAYYWYDLLMNSNKKSICQFVKNSNYDKTSVSFIGMLKKYVPEFNPKQGKSFKKKSKQPRKKLKNRIMITNGEENRVLHFEDQLPIPDGWRKMGKIDRKKLKNPIHITNGNKDLFLYWEDQLPIPDGWYKGRSNLR